MRRIIFALMMILVAVIMGSTLQSWSRNDNSGEVWKALDEVGNILDNMDAVQNFDEKGNKEKRDALLTTLVRLSTVGENLSELQRTHPTDYTAHAMLYVIAVIEQCTYLTLALNEKLEEGSKSEYEIYMRKAGWGETDAIYHWGKFEAKCPKK